MFSLPLSDLLPVHAPDAVQDDALELDQVRIVRSPATILYGFAENDTVAVALVVSPVEPPPVTVVKTAPTPTSDPPPPPPHAVMSETIRSRGILLIFVIMCTCQCVNVYTLYMILVPNVNRKMPKIEISGILSFDVFSEEF